jgi:hypothetical protein
VSLGHDLTAVYTTSAERLWIDGLRFSGQPLNSMQAANEGRTEGGPTVFVGAATGPQIRAWAGVHRVETVAAESAVPGRSLMVTPISVSAAAGLRSVSIYNGKELFRRFAWQQANKPTVLFDTLYLEATVHRTLTLVAEDDQVCLSRPPVEHPFKVRWLCPLCSHRVDGQSPPHDGRGRRGDAPSNSAQTTLTIVRLAACWLATVQAHSRLLG